jgi:hypothetical protein
MLLLLLLLLLLPLIIVAFGRRGVSPPQGVGSKLPRGCAAASVLQAVLP